MAELEFVEPTIDQPPRILDAPFAARSDRFPAKGVVSAKLDENGKVDWAGVRAKTRERWEQLTRDPDFLKEFSLQVATAGPVEIDPQFVKTTLDMMGGCMALVISLRYHLPHDVAAQIAAYTDPEKAILLPPMQRVLGKWAPELVAKWGDEFMLVVLMAQINLVKFRAAGQVAEQVKKEKEAQVKVQPQPSNGGVDASGIPA
jgi:hypothetical protein